MVHILQPNLSSRVMSDIYSSICACELLMDLDILCVLDIKTLSWDISVGMFFPLVLLLGLIIQRLYLHQSQVNSSK